jgi:hypothetical protein
MSRKRSVAAWRERPARLPIAAHTPNCPPTKTTTSATRCACGSSSTPCRSGTPATWTPPSTISTPTSRISSPTKRSPGSRLFTTHTSSAVTTWAASPRHPASSARYAPRNHTTGARRRHHSASMATNTKRWIVRRRGVSRAASQATSDREIPAKRATMGSRPEWRQILSVGSCAFDGATPKRAVLPACERSRI